MNHQNIKTSRITAIEALTKSDNEDLELIGQEPLANLSKPLANAIKSGAINSSSCFSQVFGYNTNFYYIIECVVKEKVVRYERGIGYIYEKDNRTFLKREIPIASGKNSAECIPASTIGCSPFSCCDSDCTVIYSSIPASLSESLPLDNSVLGCLSRFIPQCIQVQNYSILARLDGELQSISLEDQSLIEKLINSLCSFTKQIKLKTSKLFAKRIESETIDLIPTSNVKAKKGSLYYDESDDTIKVYNGQSWKTVQFLKD